MFQYILFLIALFFTKLGDLHNLRENISNTYIIEKNYYYDISKIIFAIYITLLISSIINLTSIGNLSILISNS